MLKRTILAFICCFAMLNAFSQATECAATIIGPVTVCETGQISLSTTNSDDYAEDPNLEWNILSVPDGMSGLFSIDDPSSNAVNINYSGPGDLPIGDYSFELCVDCDDINMDGTNDRPCDVWNLSVVGAPTEAAIEGEMFIGCNTVEIPVSVPDFDGGECYTVLVSPNDGLVTHSLDASTGILTLFKEERSSIDRQDDVETCGYEITYIINNTPSETGNCVALTGCTSETTTNVEFVYTYYRNDEVYGFITPNPACTTRTRMEGYAPGCGAIGTWELVSGPAEVEFTNVNTAIGDATVNYSEQGTYIFNYVVEGNDPCPAGEYTDTVIILDVADYDIGPRVDSYICDEVLAFDQELEAILVENTVYRWSLSNGIAVEEDNAELSEIYGPETVLSLLEDYPAEDFYLRANVTSIKAFIDPDCNGPEAVYEVQLPHDDWEQNYLYIRDTLFDYYNDHPDTCLYLCYDSRAFIYRGVPSLEGPDTIAFPCNQGSQVVRLSDHYGFSIPSFVVREDIRLIQFPLSGGTTAVDPNPEHDEVIELSTDGTYVYEYTFYVIRHGDTLCTSKDTAVVLVSSNPIVNAGTDQMKCIGESIQLNASKLQGVVGTWSIIDAGSLSVELTNSNDPLTGLSIGNIDVSSLPQDIQFEWTLASADGECEISDQTVVTIESCVNCDALSYTHDIICTDTGYHVIISDHNGNVIENPDYVVEWQFEGYENFEDDGEVFVGYPEGTVFNAIIQFLDFEADTFCTDTIIDVLPSCSAECIEGISNLTIECYAAGQVHLGGTNYLYHNGWYLNFDYIGSTDQVDIILPQANHIHDTIITDNGDGSFHVYVRYNAASNLDDMCVQVTLKEDPTCTVEECFDLPYCDEYCAPKINWSKTCGYSCTSGYSLLRGQGQLRTYCDTGLFVFEIISGGVFYRINEGTTYTTYQSDIDYASFGPNHGAYDASWLKSHYGNRVFLHDPNTDEVCIKMQVFDGDGILRKEIDTCFTWICEGAFTTDILDQGKREASFCTDAGRVMNNIKVTQAGDEISMSWNPRIKGANEMDYVMSIFPNCTDCSKTGESEGNMVCIECGKRNAVVVNTKQIQGRSAKAVVYAVDKRGQTYLVASQCISVESTKPRFEIVPNPPKGDELNIEISGEYDPNKVVTYVIRDQYGRVVAKGRTTLKELQNLEIKGLPKGSFSLEILDGDGLDSFQLRFFRI